MSRHPDAARRGAQMEWIANPEIWIALVTLTALEVVLGIDNIIFISILSGKLPHAHQSRARRIGLGLAMISRIALLLSLAWIIRLTEPLFTVLGQGISGRDLILLLGGAFLIGKATYEIHDKLEGAEHIREVTEHPSFRSVIIQIMLIDMVFSLDSVITAVGMVQQIPVMIAAVVIAVILMMWFAGPVSDFVERHPTIKMLALSFLLMIGVALIADGLGLHIPRGYIYFAMGFSVMVELLNLRLRGHPQPPPAALRSTTN
jgi:predicted tellurium resistance membrane protein TerC